MTKDPYRSPSPPPPGAPEPKPPRHPATVPFALCMVGFVAAAVMWTVLLTMAGHGEIIACIWTILLGAASFGFGMWRFG